MTHSISRILFSAILLYLVRSSLIDKMLIMHLNCYKQLLKHLESSLENQFMLKSKEEELLTTGSMLLISRKNRWEKMISQTSFSSYWNQINKDFMEIWKSMLLLNSIVHPKWLKENYSQETTKKVVCLLLLRLRCKWMSKLVILSG